MTNPYCLLMSAKKLSEIKQKKLDEHIKLNKDTVKTNKISEENKK